MRVMLTQNNRWGPSGPQAGDEGEAFYFSLNETGKPVFLVKFPGYREYHACDITMVTALITEVMDETA